MYLDAEHRNKKKKPFDFTDWADYHSEVSFDPRSTAICPVLNRTRRTPHSKRMGLIAVFSPANF